MGHQQPDRRHRLEHNDFGSQNNLYGAVYGILDTGPESLIPTWPAVLQVEFLEPTGIKWSYFARNIEHGPERLSEA